MEKILGCQLRNWPSDFTLTQAFLPKLGCCDRSLISWKSQYSWMTIVTNWRAYKDQTTLIQLNSIFHECVLPYTCSLSSETRLADYKWSLFGLLWSISKSGKSIQIESYSIVGPVCLFFLWPESAENLPQPILSKNLPEQFSLNVAKISRGLCLYRENILTFWENCGVGWECFGPHPIMVRDYFYAQSSQELFF